MPAASSSGTATATPGGPGRFQGQVDIGDGRKLYLSCSGRGTPTVILQSGYHDSSRLWSFDEPTPPAVGPSVEERLAERVRVCSYDRPGTVVYSDPPALTTRSTPVAQPRTAGAAVGDLHALVGAARLTTPVVIVAHSFGGLLARLHAQTHPERPPAWSSSTLPPDGRAGHGRPVAGIPPAPHQPGNGVRQ